MIRESGPVIQITADVRENLRSAADTAIRNTTKRLENGGILTARLDDSEGLVVDGVEVIPCAHQYGPAYHLSPDELDRMRAQAEKIRGEGRRKIAGYFHTSLGDRFNLFPDDEVVVREILPESQFILLVKPLPAGLSMARLFERNGAGRWQESAHFELHPVSTTALQPTFARPLAVSAPPFGAETEPRKWSWIPLAGGLVVVALLMLAWFELRQRPASPDPVSIIGMRVNPQGASFTIGWDRNSPALKSANEGILRILDGGQHRDIILDPSQIQTGSILYRPVSDDVTFNLELRRDGAVIAKESVRALNGLGTVAPVEVAAGGASPALPNPNGRYERRRTAVIAPTSPIVEEHTLTGPDLVATAPVSVQPPQTTAAVPPVAQPGPTANQEPASRPAETAAVKAPPTDRPIQPVPSKPVPSEAKAEVKTEPKTEAKVESKPESKVLAAAAPPPAINRPEPPPAPKPAAIGEPIVTAPKPVRKVVPNTRNLGPAALFAATEVEVQVAIDAQGRVTEAHAVTSGKKLNQALVGEALEAARKWTFEPATNRGKPIASTHLITFRFVPHS